MSTSPLGVELDWGTDMAPSGALVSGRKALAQALLRRLTTERGSLFYAPDYGYDVRELLEDDNTRLTRFQALAQIEREVLKDDRVVSARAQIESTDDGSGATVLLSIVDGAGPFALTLAVDQVRVELLTAA